MKIYSTLKIGEFHPVFCEDFNIVEKLSEDWVLIAVMDGCSSGKDSHFASALFGKILKKIAKNIPYWDFQKTDFDIKNIETRKFGKEILTTFFKELKTVQNDLFLETQEIVSTAIIAIYHPKRKELWLNISGDGIFVVNQNTYPVNQDDKPNYLAYHLDKDFETWFKEETQSNYFENVENLAISTDGIFSFAKENTLNNPEIDPVKYLLLNEEFQNTENMLNKKCTILEKEFQLKPNDDISIIRIINRQ